LISIVESIPKNRTLFTHTEHFQGLLVWIIFPIRLKTKKHFELMDEALRDEVELNKFSNSRVVLNSKISYNYTKRTQ